MGRGGRRVLVFLSDLRKRERNQDLQGISATKVKCMDTLKTLRARWKECKRKGKTKEIKIDFFFFLKEAARYLLINGTYSSKVRMQLCFRFFEGSLHFRSRVMGDL